MEKNSNTKLKLIPYSKTLLKGEDLLNESRKHYQFMNGRRTVRDFSTEAIAKDVIDNIIMTASTAPSGANKQPWTFCVVTNSKLKSKIRIGLRGRNMKVTMGECQKNG